MRIKCQLDNFSDPSEQNPNFPVVKIFEPNDLVRMNTLSECRITDSLFHTLQLPLNLVEINY